MLTTFALPSPATDNQYLAAALDTGNGYIKFATSNLEVLIPSLIRGSVTEAVTRGKVACKYYETKISAFMMIWDSDCSSLLKSSDLDWSRNYGAKIMCLSSFFIH